MQRLRILTRRGYRLHRHRFVPYGAVSLTGVGVASLAQAPQTLAATGTLALQAVAVLVQAVQTLTATGIEGRLQLSDTLRNALVAQVELTLSTSPRLHIRTGAKPANCAAAHAGVLLANVLLPADWLTAPGTPGAGSVSMVGGPWTDLSADATGVAAHFRLMDNAETVCHAQGSITVAGGGGELIVETTMFTATQPFLLDTFTWTVPGA